MSDMLEMSDAFSEIQTLQIVPQPLFIPFEKWCDTLQRNTRPRKKRNETFHSNINKMQNRISKESNHDVSELFMKSISN